MKKVSICAFVVIGTMLWVSTGWSQSIKERYGNPFIDDGAMTTSPFVWSGYDVLETRTNYDENGTPWLEHYVSKSEAKVVRELKQAYRKQKPVGPNVYVRGFIFLTQLKVWSFSLALEGTNVQYNIQVRPQLEGRGSILAMHARQRHIVNAYWKRAWYGFSPVGLDPYSASVRAY